LLFDKLFGCCPRMQLTSKELKSDLILEVQASLLLAVPLVITQILEAGVPLLDGVMMGLLQLSLKVTAQQHASFGSLCGAALYYKAGRTKGAIAP
jgi:hypothetical protein